MTTCLYQSPLGTLYVACSVQGLCKLEFIEDERAVYSMVQVSGKAGREHMTTTIAWLNLYFSGKVPSFVPSLDMNGSAFQQAVWKCLLQIPYGETVTYGAIAKEMVRKGYNARMSAQAIGRAVGKNPVSIIVPCHRVIGANGALIGYAWGIDKKEALLKIEGGLPTGTS